MNLGIVIGVSSYSNTGDLPACSVDAEVVAALLNAESKYDDVLVLSSDVTARKVKQKLTEFVSQYKGEPIDEIFFYFTGHGDFVDDEFYYLLSDYDPKRRKQTCLENTELDSLLKSLKPDLAVKFIDACHSGVAYIKDSTAFDSYLKGTVAPFKKCYFLFSSQVDQFSYQDSSLSYFTRAIVDSVLQHDETEMRYKDVIDFVSDVFSSDSKQTPFFVVQADFTELFCTVSSTIKSAVTNSLGGGGTSDEKTSDHGSKDSISLLDRIKSDAERYCSEEESNKSLTALQEKIESSAHPVDLDGLYEIQVSHGADFVALPDAKPIGNWLEQNQNDFFANPYYKTFTRKRRELKNRFMRHMEILGNLDDENYRIVTEEIERVVGFRPTIDMPFLYLLVKMEPRFPNITANDCFIVPLLSRTDIRIFYSFCEYRDVGWDKRERMPEQKWVTLSFATNSSADLDSAVSTITENYWDFVRQNVQTKFGVEDEEIPDETAEDEQTQETPAA